MTAINSGIHEVPGVRVPLQTSYGSPPHAVFMYSTSSEGVTLQLRDADDVDEKSGLASVLARLQHEDGTLSISYQDPEMLAEGSIDVLLGTGSLHSSGTNGTASFDLFDSDNGQDLTLSPQTFTSSTEAFMNDNSDSLGVPGDGDTVGSTEDAKGTPDSSKLSVKKTRPKAASPNRQGPQQCQVCGKVFGNASALAKHKLTHSDERKYVCTMCGKAFKRQDHLNGHMLTHRNKKPYECKADGCGKSYCDARSLRRHTENHHTGSSANSTSSSREASSPLASSCIQYAPPPAAPSAHTPTASTTASCCLSPASSSVSTSKAPSQLQQLLASDATTSTTPSTSSPKSGSNDGLTKQQLDLIHQIMQQTTQQKVVKAPATSVSSSSLSVTTKAGVLAKAKTWTTQSPAVGGAKSSVALPSQNCQTSSVAKPEPKPVECNLCHRKFKNIPALNGHMRLHGGYFKKDSDAKKCEKKEAAGPPLQTASMSVRALIEEKIIQKRSSNNLSNVANKLGESNGVRSVTSQVPSTSPCRQQEPDLNAKLSSFVVPAPPMLSPMPAAEKLRRHSDSEHFNSSRAVSGVQHEAQALADLLLKRSKKLSVKRASSDPGAQGAPSSPLTLSASSSPGPQLQLSFQTSEYSLGAVSYQAEDGGYFSPSLQEDVFQHVSADSMLLQGVDANQLAESLQFQASLLQDHSENLSLEEYQGSHSQDLQAVLNSPLPVGLAEFGAYGSSQAQSPKGLHYQNSPLPSNKDFTSYVNSPHPSLGTASPLPSPVTHHDSPSFTYPTPPASQEGQSPSFGQSMLSGPQADSFVQSVISHGGGPVPVSSPLSAAFYTTTMSSAAAVEEALSEVLPLDSQNTCNGPVRMGMYHRSPPHSPLSATPVPSPMSLSSVPVSSSSVSSPLPQNAFNNSRNHPFPLSPQQTLQSQMMPNSDDPLLSSSPKDFASKKKFDFSSVHPSFKLIGNGMVDLGPGGLGFVIDNHGDLKILHTTASQAKGLVMSSTAQPAKGLVMTTSSIPQTKGVVVTSAALNQSKGLLVPSGTAFINTSTNSYVRKVESSNQLRLPGKGSNTVPQLLSPTNMAMRLQHVKLPVPLDNIKEEVDEDVFRSPARWISSPHQILASPSRSMRRGATRSDPLHCGTHHPCYQSRLRAPRVKECGTPTPYTPSPMLSPSRPGQGLYWQAAQAAPANSCLWPTSTTAYGVQDRTESPDTPPECSATPRINVGPRHQAMVPAACGDRSRLDRDPSYEHLLWDPGISKFCTDAEIDMYLEFSCCAAVPGGGRNREYALHLLHMCHYNIHEAMLKLMQPTPWLPPGHPLLAYEYAEGDKWSADEVDTFHQGLLKFDKDFRTIAQEIGSKTIRQCIQFYYLWKKICPEEYKRLRLLRRRKEVESSTPILLHPDDIKVETSRRCSPVNDVDLVSTSSESRLFVCEYSDCSASFNSRAALSGHIRIHGGTMGSRAPTPDRRGPLGDSLEEFPCKICGKVFNKVKSRSAHMKSHRPPDAEPKKPKLDPQKLELAVAAAAADQCAVRTMAVSSSGPASKLV